MIRNTIALAFLSIILFACATITDVAYQPQPSRITDPRAEVKAIILANTVQGCVADPDVGEKMLVVKFVCSNGKGGVGNSVVRFDNVGSITLQQSGEWYRVLVRHKNGADDFSWGSKNLDDMQRMADAFTALKAANDAPADAAKTGTPS